MFKKLSVVFVCFISLYISSFYSGALWDDNVFIFEADSIIKSSHPFIFFNYKSDNFRAWPLGYVIFWFFYNLFGTKFYIYKFINILLHFINFLLVRKYTESLGIKNSLIIGLIFLIHPLHVETISWIFQFNTIVSLTFALLALIYLERSILKSCSFFALSVFTKSYAAFLPFFILAFFFSKNLHWKIITKKTLPFFIVGLLAGLSTIRGVNQSGVESTLSKHFHTRGAVTTTYKATPVAESEAIPTEENSSETQDAAPLNGDVNKDTVDSVKSTIAPTALSQDDIIKDEFVIVKEEKIDYVTLVYSKLLLMGETISFYTLSFLMPIEQYFFYANENLSLASTIGYLLIFFIVLTSITLTMTNRSALSPKKLSLWIILFASLWLPVSGVFYVPFMKYSLYADHWSYLMVFPLSVILVIAINFVLERFNHFFKRTSPVLIFSIPIAFFIIKTSFYARTFNDHEYMLERNITHNPSSTFLRRYLADSLYRNGELKRAIQVLELAQQIDSADIPLSLQLQRYREDYK